MAPSPPRLRILSGEQFVNSKIRNVCITVNPFVEARLQSLNNHVVPHVLIPPFSTCYHKNELSTKKILYSRRKRCLRFLIVEATSNKCLRCHAGVEVQLPSGSAVRHILQVS